MYCCFPIKCLQIKPPQWFKGNTLDSTLVYVSASVQNIVMHLRSHESQKVVLNCLLQMIGKITDSLRPVRLNLMSLKDIANTKFHLCLQIIKTVSANHKDSHVEKHGWKYPSLL